MLRGYLWAYFQKNQIEYFIQIFLMDPSRKSLVEFEVDIARSAQNCSTLGQKCSLFQHKIKEKIQREVVLPFLLWCSHVAYLWRSVWIQKIALSLDKLRIIFEMAYQTSMLTEFCMNFTEKSQFQQSLPRLLNLTLYGDH